MASATSCAEPGSSSESVIDAGDAAADAQPRVDASTGADASTGVDAGPTCGPGTFINGGVCTPCPAGTFVVGNTVGTRAAGTAAFTQTRPSTFRKARPVHALLERPLLSKTGRSAPCDFKRLAAGTEQPWTALQAAGRGRAVPYAVGTLSLAQRAAGPRAPRRCARVRSRYLGTLRSADVRGVAIVKLPEPCFRG